MFKVKNRLKRKNITISPETERDLIKLSKEMGKPQSKVIESLIKEKAKKIRKKEKINALYNIRGKLHAIFGGKNIQSIKSEMNND